ncbi:MULTISPECIES: DUF4314 domain-containing protein [unclassified Corynebacterium]|uniref:DUF4314 domain-containing protein n=1 Tax=unclassified Corynebacterium TaxID=2624378 RepID=UPI00211CFA61|nr:MULTISPECIES: DUF4314 domain-containing protein [unclassified Corynebacterium]MCQ9359246.1 DUF4314 domain-containing protein [Corynebacterium sp. 142RC1]MCQ9365387.1 DUF4314 domain-containing protein [Corynebacterium sp. 70RC1]
MNPTPTPGTRIRLINTSDPYTTLIPGDEGTIELIDDAGTIHVTWDTGSRMGLIPGEDTYLILEQTSGQ